MLDEERPSWGPPPGVWDPEALPRVDPRAGPAPPMRCKTIPGFPLEDLSLRGHYGKESNASGGNSLFSFLSQEFYKVTTVLGRGSRIVSESTDGSNKWEKKTGQACEIPNRTGKNNIINYGSPQAASGQALCGASPGTRKARVSSVVRACGWRGPLRPPRGDESEAPRDPGDGGPEPAEPRSPLLAGIPERGPGLGTAGARGAGRCGGGAGAPSGRRQLREGAGAEAGVTRGTPIWPGSPPAPAAGGTSQGRRRRRAVGAQTRASVAPAQRPAASPGRPPCPLSFLPSSWAVTPGSLRAGGIKGASALRRNCNSDVPRSPRPPALNHPTYCCVFVLFSWQHFNHSS
uniref:Uncharacterized protein n=1 Tax=Rangifer tarandus platyrhynchus TaxID=3082113 RepID=A0ACB0DX96_RANTA|nr:unnamed protein product [Rangifer tarandus platyrhynchus]